MDTVWGVVVLIVSLLGWLGQMLTVLSPKTAEELGVTEPEADVDPTFYVDVRAEAYWDAVSLWPLTLAGLLLIMNEPAWAYLGLVGGGIFVYFAGRGIVVRTVMQRRGIRIGAPDAVKTNIAALALFGVVGLVTMIVAVADLPLS